MLEYAGDKEARQILERLASGAREAGLTMEARATLDRQIEQISAAIPTEDARLRAALIMATMLGVTIGHQLLGLDALRDASPEQVASLLRPCFQLLTGSQDHSA